MLNIAKAVFGGMMLFLGLDLDWLFSIGIGLLVGLKMTPLLPAGSASWLPFLLIAAMGIIGFLPHIIYPESHYIVTGFLFGGYMFSEYTSTVLNAFLGIRLAGSNFLIFFVGAVIGSLFLVLAKEWGILLATALLGAFLAVGLVGGLSHLTSSLIAVGLFLLGAIVQIVIMQFQDASEK